MCSTVQKVKSQKLYKNHLDVPDRHRDAPVCHTPSKAKFKIPILHAKYTLL